MTVKVGIEIPRELHTRVKIEAARRRIKIKDACREALRAGSKQVMASKTPSSDGRWELPAKR